MLCKKARSYLIIPLVIILLTILFEIFCQGAVLRFANPEGEPYVQTYSYFDLTPLGYANFGPFLTAVLTVIIAVVLLLAVITKRRWLCLVCIVLCSIAIMASIAPLMFGADYYSIEAFSITAMLGSTTGFLCHAYFHDRAQRLMPLDFADLYPKTPNK